MPDLPPSWPAAVDLRLRWRDEEGRPRERALGAGELTRLLLLPGERRALLLEASYRGRALRPGGALWPDSLRLPSGPGKPCRLFLSWEEGWVAGVLSWLEERGGGRGVDFRRLETEASARLGDPWLVEPAFAARLLLEGRFRADTLKAGQALPLVLPGPGPWFSDSALAPRPLASGGSWTLSLPPGLHRWFSADLELLLSVGEEGEISCLIRNLGEP